MGDQAYLQDNGEKMQESYYGTYYEGSDYYEVYISNIAHFENNFISLAYFLNQSWIIMLVVNIFVLLSSSCTVPETSPLENFLEEMKNLYALIFTSGCKQSIYRL